MKIKRTHLDYLRDILDAIEKALQFTAGMDIAQFRVDERTNFAVVRALEVIGEAARKIPLDVQESYPEVPWQEMMAMRNKLIHDYFGVDLDVVWQTVHQDLPPLRAQIAEAIARQK